MKILRSIHSLNPATGGPLESIKQSSLVLAARGHHVEIVCFDSPGVQFGGVTFTHIQQNEVMMARSAVELLLEQIKGDVAPDHRVIDFSLKEAERL